MNAFMTKRRPQILRASGDGRCKNCHRPLTESPEPERSEWFSLCLACGAKNILSVEALQIVGWHE
jgi:hypothetical protein